MYYEHTLAHIHLALRQKDSEKIITPEPANSPDRHVPTAGHILWMACEISYMDTQNVGDAAKAGRWIGYILLWMELHRFWNNQTSRDLVRTDVENRLDQPH